MGPNKVEIIQLIRKEYGLSIAEAFKVLKDAIGPEKYLCVVSGHEFNAHLNFKDGPSLRVMAKLQ